MKWAKFAAAALGMVLTLALTIVCYRILTFAQEHELVCRGKTLGGFCVVSAKDGSGVSVQYFKKLTIWAWDADGENNRLLWPVE